MIINFLNLVIQFILDNIITPFVSSFFIVVGGATPIAILIYLFSKEEGRRLRAHAKEIEKTLPLQELLLKKMTEVISTSISPQSLSKNIDQFKQLIESQNIIEENKKFIKYAENYNFISAVGHVLKMSNYMPKSIGEHKEISKDLPGSLSGDA